MPRRQEPFFSIYDNNNNKEESRHLTRVIYVEVERGWKKGEGQQQKPVNDATVFVLRARKNGEEMNE